MVKPVLFSGIQPTGRLHIGNYLGALKNFVTLQNTGKYQCYFFVVDLHSLTESPTPEELRINILGLTADYLAAGIDPEKSTIAQQSHIPAHSELAWILNTITPMGELQRMTQFKDKSLRQEHNINVGLFDYPVLMAADILLYNTAFVPVGDDQDQHLELARTLARKFNSRFPAHRSLGVGGGDTFVEPKGIHTATPRIMSLSDPTRKMSKSEPLGCIFLDDSSAEIEAKVKRAVTDSGSEIKFNEEKRPAISNLLRIYSSFADEPIPAVEKQFTGKTYSDFKLRLAALIAEYLSSFWERRNTLIKKPATLKKTLRIGSKKASVVATQKINDVRAKLGIA